VNLSLQFIISFFPTLRDDNTPTLRDDNTKDVFVDYYNDLNCAVARMEEASATSMDEVNEFSQGVR
jgi:hypothetical protein